MPSTIQRTFQHLSRKIKEENLALVKADKGGTLVLLTRDQYNKKMHDLLQSSGARPSNACLTKYNADIRGLIKASSLVISGNDN